MGRDGVDRFLRDRHTMALATTGPSGPPHVVAMWYGFVGPALWTSSFLPAQYQATTVFTEDMRVEKLVANVKNSALTREQQQEL